MPEQLEPTPDDAKIEKHPISSFNLNAHGENPDLDLPGAPNLSPSPELTQELSERQTITDPESGQKLGLLELNRHSESRPLVSLLEYSVDAQHPDTNYMLEQVAIQSGRHMLVLENPSVGNSDNLTDEQRAELKNNNFEPIARSMLGALKSRGVTEIDLEGSSLAGRMAAALAAEADEHGITVHNLVMIEPAGFDQTSFTAMINRLIVKEGLNMQQYAKHVRDPRGKAAQDSPLDVVKNYSKMIKKDAKGNIGAYPSAILSGTLEEDLELALYSQPHMKVHLISGGASEVTKRDDANRTYDNLSASYGDRIHMIRLPGDTHMFNVGSARRVGWHVSRLLDQPKNS